MRYADPFKLLNGMIRTRRLEEFICEFIKIRNDETEENTLWEFFLHKVFDKTYQEFLDQIKEPDVAPSEDKLINIVSDSYDTLKDFSPF